MAGSDDVDDRALLQLAEELQAKGELKRAIDVLNGIAPSSACHDQVQASLAAVRALIAKSQRKLAGHLQWLDADTRYPAPYVAFTGRPHGDRGRLDGMGFPNAAEPTPDKPSGELRVFVVGDSCVFDADESGLTLTDLVSERLSREGRMDVKVFNFGVRSSLAEQMLSLIFFKLVDYQPDLILVCCGSSSVYVPLSYDPRPGYPYNFYAVEELYAQFFDFQNIDAESVAVGYQDFIDGLAIRHAELRKKVGWGSPHWEHSIIAAFGKFLEKVAKTSAAFEIDMAVCLQPLVTCKRSPVEAERAMLHTDTANYFLRQYDRLGALFRDGVGAKRLGRFCSLHDLSDVFEHEDAQIFIDFTHYNLRGKRLMADRISQIILGKL